VALAAGFDFGLLDSVGLKEAVKLRLVAPAAAIVVELDFAGRQIADGWILPTGELHGQAFDRPTEEFMKADHWSRRNNPDLPRWQLRRVSGRCRAAFAKISQADAADDHGGRRRQGWNGKDEQAEDVLCG